MKYDRKEPCPIRHENGNCTCVGGFCTAVSDPICEAVRNAYDSGYRAGIIKATVLEPWAQNLLENVRDLVEQFAYKITNKGRAAYTTGGLSALEAGFAALGWDDPRPAPECECQHPDCHEWATCGTPTKDGYKFLCYHHYEAELANREAEKNDVEQNMAHFGT